MDFVLVGNAIWIWVDVGMNWLGGLFGCVLGAVATSAVGAAELPDVPSGQSLTIFEQVIETDPDDGRVLFLGLLAPAISRDGGTVSYDRARLDMDHICQTFVLPQTWALAETGGLVSQLVVRLMDRPVVRGIADSSATQFISVYAIAGGECEWQ